MDKQAQIEHGDPAFPCDRISVNGGVVCTTGMTLRDHFAAKAMRLYFLGEDSASRCGDPKQIAAWSYEVADAMLEART